MRTENSSVAAAEVDDNTTATLASAPTASDDSFVNVPIDIGSGNALDLAVTPEHDIVGLLSRLTSTRVCVTMKARDLPEEDSSRAPVDIVVALDCSGSMKGTKLELCKKTLLFLLRVLYPKDRFCLITYADDARVDIPIQTMTEENKQQCAQIIPGLHTRGSTNISAAIGLACQELAQLEDPNSVQTVFLLTDGYANAGISNFKDLVELTKNCFADDTLILQGTEGAEDRYIHQATNRVRSWNPFQRKRNSSEKSCKADNESVATARSDNTRSPITLHCFGYGGYHNSDLLQQMSAVVPGGSYYFVENDNNVGGAFGDALGGILSVVAQNAVVTVSVPEEAKKRGVEIVDVYYNQRLKRENGSYTITVGDFYAEESRDVLMKLKLATPTDDDATDPIPHVTASVAYTDTLQKMPAFSNAVTCSIARPSGTAEVSESNHHVEAQWLRLVATKAMTEANTFASCRDFASAKRTIQAMKARVESVSGGARFAGTASKEMLDTLTEDMDTMEKQCFESESRYECQGKHGLSNMHATYMQQRCMTSTAPGSELLRKKAKRAAFQGKSKHNYSTAFQNPSNTS